MAQLYVNDLGFTKVYPMKTKTETSVSLSAFIHEVGIPDSLHSDNAKELTHGKFKTICKEYMISTSYTELHSPWQNRAESGIRELKRHVNRIMKACSVPLKLWDFCVKWSCEVRAKTASNNLAFEGRTPFEAVMGSTPDISSLIDFDFYQPVWHLDETSSFPEPKRKLGRWLGEAHGVRQAMCYWILPNTCIPIAESTVSHFRQTKRLPMKYKRN